MQVSQHYAETTGGCECIFLFSGINYTRLYNNLHTDYLSR